MIVVRREEGAPHGAPSGAAHLLLVIGVPADLQVCCFKSRFLVR